ncbi:MAG: hypothetical protein GY820_08535 [Gammaproteobacteria bacterium]|nr:hypothetical protein [Gammaproteobacteria bacterium]
MGRLFKQFSRCSEQRYSRAASRAQGNAAEMCAVLSKQFDMLKVYQQYDLQARDKRLACHGHQCADANQHDGSSTCKPT